MLRKYKKFIYLSRRKTTMKGSFRVFFLFFGIVLVTALLVKTPLLPLGAKTLAGKAGPVLCGGTAPSCAGACPMGQACLPSGTLCTCQPQDIPCGGVSPVCTGGCPANLVCSALPGSPQCTCIAPTGSTPTPPPSPPSSTPPTCGNQGYPYCSNGPCPSGQTCQARGGSCQCVNGVPDSGGGGAQTPQQAQDTPTIATLRPDCGNLPYGYDLVTFNVEKEYAPQKINLYNRQLDRNKVITSNVRRIVVHSCNPQAFDNPDPAVILPSGEVTSRWVIPASQDGSRAFIITGIEGATYYNGQAHIAQGDFRSPLYFNFLTILDEAGVLLRRNLREYWYWPSLFPSPYSKYRNVVYDPYNKIMRSDISVEGEVYWRFSRPISGIQVDGGSPVVENKDSLPPNIIFRDAVKKHFLFSDYLALLNIQDKVFLDLAKIFDAYPSYSGWNWIFTGDFSSTRWDNFEEYYGYDQLIVHYDPMKNAFVAPPGFISPVEVISVKADQLLAYPFISPTQKIPPPSYTPHAYPVPFILTSGTNVVSATSDEIVVLFSQKHQNRPAVTFGTLYDNKQPVSSTSCVDACLMRASGLPSTCAPVSECQLNCPVDAAVQKKINACGTKLKNFYVCQKNAVAQQRPPSASNSKLSPAR